MLELMQAMAKLPLFALVICRMSGLMLVAPIFSTRAMPTRLKIGLVVATSLVMFPFAVYYAKPLPTSVAGYVPVFVSELGLGVLLGFLGAMLIAAVEMAGGFASQQLGLAMASTVAPDSGESTDAVSVFLSMLVVLFMLAINAHHWFIMALAASYRAAPLGEITWRPLIFQMLEGDFAAMFVVSLRMVAPLIGFMFLVNIMIALVAKTAPQMHILMVAYPVKILVGMVILAITLPLAWPVIRQACEVMHARMGDYVTLF